MRLPLSGLPFPLILGLFTFKLASLLNSLSFYHYISMFTSAVQVEKPKATSSWPAQGGHGRVPVEGLCCWMGAATQNLALKLPVTKEFVLCFSAP